MLHNTVSCNLPYINIYIFVYTYQDVCMFFGLHYKLFYSITYYFGYIYGKL